MLKILLILLSFTVLSCSKETDNNLPTSGKQKVGEKQKDVFSICNKSIAVKHAILFYLQKDISTKKELSCDKITKKDLLKITSFKGVNYLQAQYIMSLKQKDFDGLSNLKIIDLSNNKLQTLPDGIFNNLNKLERITLSGNQLRTLPKDVFKTSKKLILVDLANNDLQSIPEGMFSFKALPMLKRLYLQQNDFSSDYKNKLQERIYENRGGYAAWHVVRDLFSTPKFVLQVDGTRYSNKLQN